MTEKELRNFLTEKLAQDGWIAWWAPRVKFRKVQDIFSIYDGICAKGGKVRLIQFTTKENKSSHVGKMTQFRKLYGLTHEAELWLYDKKTRDFEIIYF